MDIISILAKKRDGVELSQEEIAFFVRGAVDGSIKDYQITAFLMAGRINGFSIEETVSLTMEMVNSGLKMDLSDVPGVKVDKHSTGGVGDKTSLILMPIIACAGLKGAKMSGRGLGHTGGTLDKLESITGFSCNLGIEKFKQQLTDVGFAIIGQNEQMVPADKLFYALRDVTATVDSIPLIASSIMSKKIAMGANVLVLDVKYGSGALVKDPKTCRQLSELMLRLANRFGIKASALITSMEQPLGHAIGNSLEIKEVLDVLRGNGPEDLRHVSLSIAAEQIYLSGIRASREEAYSYAENILSSGAALEKFSQMVRAQGGSDNFNMLSHSNNIIEYRSDKSGWIAGFDTAAIGKASVMLGGGRLRKEDSIDYAAGLVICKKIGDKVDIGDVLAYLHCGDQSDTKQAVYLLDSAIKFSDIQTSIPPLIKDIIVN